MLRRFTLLPLFTLLFAPTAVPAQPSLTAKAAPRTVTIQVAFVTASDTDIDNLGINFDLIPTFAPIDPPNIGSVQKMPTFFAVSATKTVGELYKTLTRVHGKTILALPVTTTENTAATILVDAPVPEYQSLVTTVNTQDSFPQLTGSVRIKGTLTLTPHILPGNIVNFEMASPVKGGKPITLRPVASGEPIVIVAYGYGRTNIPLLGNLFRTRVKVLDTNELLIFITPTIQPEIAAPKTVSIDVTGVKLQTVVNMLGRQTDIEAVIKEGEKPFPPVTVNLSGCTLAQALKVIALSAGAVVTRNRDGVYVFQQEDAVAEQWHTISLYHISASSVLGSMHCNAQKDRSVQTIKTSLPDGVMQVSAIQDDNFLLLRSTSEGYLQMRQIVRILDQSAQKVKLQVVIATLSPDAKLFAEGTLEENLRQSNPATLLARLRKAKVLISPPATWTTPTHMTVEIYQDKLSGLSLTPHTHKDKSVTLYLCPTIHDTSGQQPYSGPPTIVTRIGTPRTAQSSTMVLFTQKLFEEPDSMRLIFVTPTVIGEFDDYLPGTSDERQVVTISP